MFAIWKVGAVVVALNASFTVGELTWHLEDSGAVLLVGDTAGSHVIATARQKASTLRSVLWIESQDGVSDCGEPDDLNLDELIAANTGGHFHAVEVATDDLAWIGYTSGTTGNPKGAMLSHRSLMAQALSSLADVQRLEQHHVAMHAAPLSHGSGHNALPFTMKGCTQVIHRRTAGFDAGLFLDQVEKYRVAALFLVPTQIRLILDQPDVEERDLSSLEWVMYGGAPMYRKDQIRALRVLGPVLVQIFGQTETPMSGTVLRREEHSVADGDGRELSVGRVRHGMEMRIVDESGIDMGPGGVGEICFRGDTVMNGYWRRPEASAEAIVDGWLHTGDIGRLDDRGYLYILDRAKDMIISGGLNVYPLEVEEVLLKHPDVVEVCVIGVPDEKWGEAVRAVVVANRKDLTAEELIGLVGEHLAPYKKPKAVDFVDSLPRTPYGKVAKREVRATYWAHLDRAL
jgi:acyl-CoA synthetase (AMP-forming)/AMP-acid ligase II